MNRSRRKYWLSYTALFALILAAVLGWLISQGRSLVLGGDPVAQHLRALIYYSRWLRELPGYLLREHALPAYSLSIGLGSDVITTLQFYVVGDPLNLLCAFIPAQYMAIFYSVMIPVRMYLAGVSFSCMCFTLERLKRKELSISGRAGEGAGQEAEKSEGAILAGALTLVFSAYTIFGGWRHPFFLNPLIYMPLVITGAEKIRSREGHLLFTLAVALSAVSNFYFFYMIALVTVVYALWRCVCLYRGRAAAGLGWLVQMGLSALTGVLVSGIILLPVVTAFLGNPRSVEGYLFDSLYTADYYLRFPGSLVTFWAAGEWSYIGISSVSLLAILALVVRRRRKDLTVLLFLGTAALLVPAAGYVMNGFSYVSTRWVWAYILLCAYMVTEGWEALRSLRGREGFPALVLLWLLSAHSAYDQGRLNLRIQLVLAGLGLLILLLRRRRSRGGMAAAFSLLVLGICCNGLFGIIPQLGGVGNGYYQWSRVVGEDAEVFDTESAAIRAIEGADTFYRYSGKDLSGNASVQDGVPSTQFYWSLANGYVSRFFEKLGLCYSYADAFANFDDRTILNEISGVKDFYTRDSTHVPYGYTLLEAEENPQGQTFPIYRNTYTLPLGITYGTWISEDAFDGLDQGARQEVILRSAVLASGNRPAEDEAGPAADLTGVPGLTQRTAQEAPVERTVPAVSVSSSADSARIEGNTITVLQEGAKIRIKFAGTPRSESYLYLGDIDYLPPGGSYTDLPERLQLKVKGYAGKEKMSSKTLTWFTRKEKWYAGRNSFMFPSGYHSEKLTSFVLTLPAVGVYTFSEIAVFTQPLGEGYIAAARELGRETPARIDLHTGQDTRTWATSRVDADITVSSDRLLCLQMAYSDGWQAWVDGQEVPVLRTNLMYMGIPLAEGTHTVTLRYVTPGLVTGAYLTLAGILIILLYLYEGKRRKGRRHFGTEGERQAGADAAPGKGERSL